MAQRTHRHPARTHAVHPRGRPVGGRRGHAVRRLAVPGHRAGRRQARSTCARRGRGGSRRDPGARAAARRLPRAVARVRRARRLHRREPGRAQPGVRSAAAQPGARPGSAAPPAHRRGQHRRDLVAGAGTRAPRGDQVRAYPAVGRHRPRARDRFERAADPRGQPRRRPAEPVRRRGPSAASRRRICARGCARTRQRARRVRAVSLVHGTPRARIRPRRLVQPERVCQAGQTLGVGAPEGAACRSGHREAALDGGTARPASRRAAFEGRDRSPLCAEGLPDRPRLAGRTPRSRTC